MNVRSDFEKQNDTTLVNRQRRRFVQSATAGAVAIAGSLVTNAASYGRVPGANERLRTAVVGFKGRGRALVNAIGTVSGMQLVALADADKKILTEFQPENRQLRRVADFRELLTRDDIDVVASATPNHWHTLVTCLACQAGKHVYIEKPISHNMLESQRVVQVARKYNSIVQCGFQNRSDTGLIPFFDRLLSGEFGSVKFVYGTCNRKRASIGKLTKPLVIPNHIDFDLWSGPAEMVPITRPKLHYDWHWDFRTGNGDVGNQGPHEWDMMNWALGNPKELPTKMISAGNRFGWNDAGDTPNVMGCAGVTNGIPFCFEVMDLAGGRTAPYGRGVGVIIETDKGRFIGGRGGGRFVFRDGKTEVFQRDQSQKGQDGTPAHMANFEKAVRQRDRSLLRSECVIAANSSAMAHMANISYQLAVEAAPEQLESAFGKNVSQRDMIARLRESVWLFAASQNQGKLDLDGEPWRLGPELNFDSSAYEFQGASSTGANRLMSRNYRAGYELPKV